MLHEICNWGIPFVIFSYNIYTMSKSQLQQKQTVRKNHKPPENKDNIDSRKKEEDFMKGDDTTHNKKDKQSEKPRRQRL